MNLKMPETYLRYMTLTKSKQNVLNDRQLKRILCICVINTTTVVSA